MARSSCLPACETPNLADHSGLVILARVPRAGAQTAEDIAGDSVTFGCGEGMVLLGSDRLVCDAGTHSYGTLPVCTSTCDAPARPLNGVRSGAASTQSLFLEGDRVEFTCDEGFQHFGKRFLTCMPGGSFDVVAPLCRKVADVTVVDVTFNPPLKKEVATQVKLKLFPGDSTHTFESMDVFKGYVWKRKLKMASTGVAELPSPLPEVKFDLPMTVGLFLHVELCGPASWFEQSSCKSLGHTHVPRLAERHTCAACMHPMLEQISVQVQTALTRKRLNKVDTSLGPDGEPMAVVDLRLPLEGAMAGTEAKLKLQVALT